MLMEGNLMPPIYPSQQASGYKTLIYPGIFILKENPATRSYFLDFKTAKYKTPPKYYGEIRNYIDFYWKNIVRNNYNGGILLTGQKGSGKSMLSMEIANRAVDAGMRVVEITKIKFTPELISYIDSLDNAVLFFDEFGKNFNKQQQDQMLTMLSNGTGKQRITIITENNKMAISDFIRSRPGRIRYAMHFNKLPRSTLVEYCEEFPVKKEFMDDLLKVYSKAVEFQFDHLKAIIEEHLNNPEISLEDLIKLMNLDNIALKKLVKVKRIIDLKDPDKQYKILNADTPELDQFELGYRLYLTIEEVISEEETKEQNDQPFMPKRGMLYNTSISKKNILKFVDDVIEAELSDKPDLIAILEIEYQN